MSSRFNSSALVFGLVFITLGTMFLLEELDYWDLDASYVLPVLLIGLGLGVAIGARQTNPR